VCEAVKSAELPELGLPLVDLTMWKDRASSSDFTRSSEPLSSELIEPPQAVQRNSPQDVPKRGGRRQKNQARKTKFNSTENSGVTHDGLHSRCDFSTFCYWASTSLAMVSTRPLTASTLFWNAACSSLVNSNSIIRSTPPTHSTTGTPT